MSASSDDGGCAALVGAPDVLLLGHPWLAFPLAALGPLPLGVPAVRVVASSGGRTPARRRLCLVGVGTAAPPAESPALGGDDVVVVVDLADTLAGAVPLAAASHPAHTATHAHRHPAAHG